MVEQQRIARVPVVLARELLRNSLRSFPDPAPMMQLGLLFATAKLPGLQTGRGLATSWSHAEPWWPEEPIVDPDVFYCQPPGPL
jgi:hypothetical protein